MPWALELGLPLGLESWASVESIYYWALVGPMGFGVIYGLVSGLPLDLENEGWELDPNLRSL